MALREQQQRACLIGRSSVFQAVVVGDWPPIRDFRKLPEQSLHPPAGFYRIYGKEKRAEMREASYALQILNSHLNQKLGQSFLSQFSETAS
jgi:hypothetical protein